MSHCKMQLSRPALVEIVLGDLYGVSQVLIDGHPFAIDHFKVNYGMLMDFTGVEIELLTRQIVYLTEEAYLNRLRKERYKRSHSRRGGVRGMR